MSGVARVAIASILFGFAGIFARLAYDHGSDAASAFAVRGLALLPWFVAFASPWRRAEARAAWRPLTAMAALGALNAGTWLYAIERMSPAIVALVFYAYPVLVLAGAHFLGWTRVTALSALAAGATLAGVVVTVGLPNGEANAPGVLLALANAVGYAVYLLLAQRALQRASAVTVIAFVGGVSSVLVVAAALPAGASAPGSAEAMASLAGLAIVSILVPHVILLSGLRLLGSAWSSLTACLEVVTAVVATAIVLHDPLGTGAAVGGALIVLGGVAAPIMASRRRLADAT
jgi:drug/metabolite transporter (DMT)-like permease